VVVVVVVIGLMVKGTRILVVDPLKSWLRVPQKVMPRNPDKLAYAKSSEYFPLAPLHPTLSIRAFAVICRHDIVSYPE